ncbi:MAG: hypothetical protein QXD03_05300 [Candidatus Anstonellales archaeon]
MDKYHHYAKYMAKFFDGHKVIIIDNEWMLDVTEFIGYKIDYDDEGKIKSAIKAYTISIDRENNKIEFKRHIKVPTKIIMRSAGIIYKDLQDALIGLKLDEVK